MLNILQNDWGIKDILALANVGALFAVVMFWIYSQNKKKVDDAKKEQTAGEMRPERWDAKFDEIKAIVKECNNSNTEAMRDLTRAINELTMTLLRSGK